MILDDVRLAINNVYKDKPVLAKLCLAQAIVESNLDGKPSKLAVDFKNLFGIKDIDGKNKKDLQTTECSSKGCWQESQAFEVYNTYEDSIAHHRALMQKPRYNKVWNASSFEDACIEVWKAGYATDPNYPKKLMARYYKNERV